MRKIIIKDVCKLKDQIFNFLMKNLKKIKGDASFREFFRKRSKNFTSIIVLSKKERQTYLQKYNGVHLALAWRTFCKATVSKIPFVFFYNDCYPKLPLHLPGQGTNRCKKNYVLRFCFQRFCVQRFSLSEMLTFRSRSLS